MPMVPAMARVTFSQRAGTKDRWLKRRWNPRLSPSPVTRYMPTAKPEVEPADAVVPEDHDGQDHRDQREGDQEGGADELDLSTPGAATASGTTCRPGVGQEPALEYSDR